MNKSQTAWLAAGVSILALSSAWGQTAPPAPEAIDLPSINVEAPSPFETQTSAPGGSGGLIVVPDAFAPVTVMTRDEIVRSTARTLGDLLAVRPGISSSSFAPGVASRPVIRGLDNNRVRIQENGIGIHDASTLGEDHAVPLDPFAARQVEVVRGPATLRWGSQAIGGVVNVTNNRIPTALPPRGMNVELEGGYSSVDRGADGGIWADFGHGNVAIHADAFGRNASAYGIPSYPYLFPDDHAPTATDGRQPNSFAKSHGQSLGGTYFFDGGFVGAAISSYRSLYGIPGQEGAEEKARIDMRQTRFTAKGEFRPQSSILDTVRFWLGGSDYHHNELASHDGGEEIHQTFTNRAWEGRTEFQFVPYDLSWATLNTAFGIQASHQRLTASSEDGGLFDPNRTASVAAFLFNEFDFRQGTRFQLAGRVEHVRVDGTMPDLFVNPDVAINRNLRFTPASVSAGLLQDLPMGLVASLTAQHVERAPRAAELFSRGGHHATGTFDVGNPNLGIESAQTIEFGLKRAEGPLRFDASVYHTRFNGFIYRRLTDQFCREDFASCHSHAHHDDHDDDHDDDHGHHHEEEHGHGHGHESRQALYTQRDARFTGAEIAAQLDVAPLGSGMFGIDGMYDIVRARFSDGSVVPRLPAQRFGGGIWWRSNEWFARIGAIHALKQSKIADEETPTSAYTLLKAELSYTTTLRHSGYGVPQEITLGIVGDNLLDADVRNHVSFRKDDVLQPGRTVRVFARTRF